MHYTIMTSADKAAVCMLHTTIVEAVPPHTDGTSRVGRFGGCTLHEHMRSTRSSCAVVRETLQDAVVPPSSWTENLQVDVKPGRSSRITYERPNSYPASDKSIPCSLLQQICSELVGGCVPSCLQSSLFPFRLRDSSQTSDDPSAPVSAGNTDSTKGILILTIVPTSLSGIVAGLRFATRAWISKNLGWDDYTMMFAIVRALKQE